LRRSTHNPNGLSTPEISGETGRTDGSSEPLSTDVGDQFLNDDEQQVDATEDELAHLRQIHSILRKNVRILKVQIFQHGGRATTPLIILNQFDGAQKDLAETVRQLQELGDSMAPTRPVSAHTSERQVFDLSFHLYCPEPPPELEAAVRRALAELLEIGEDEVIIRKRRLGSIIYTVELPKEAAKRLQKLAKQGRMDLIYLGLYRIEVVPDEDKKEPRQQNPQQ
jgi:hypothetical protein